MKSFITMLLACFLISSSASSQVLFTENFVYTGNNGDSLTSPTIGGAIWKTHSGGSNSIAKLIQFQNSSLSLTGYTGSGLGGSVTFQNTVRTQDVNAAWGTNLKTGSVYASFLLRIDSSAGKDTTTEYFFSLCDTSGAKLNNFRGRVFVSDGSSPSTFKIGISKGTNAKSSGTSKLPTFTATEYNLGQTYLVVIKYTFNTTGTKDDIIDLFIIDATVPATEPAAAISYEDTAISDLKQIQSLVIRQASIGRTKGALDGFKVFTNWSDMFGATATFTITASAGANGTITPSGGISVSSGANQTFTIAANSGYAIQDVLVDGVSQGAIATYTFTNVTTAHTISASFNVSTVTTYTITASAGANGSITPSGAVLVNSGSNQSFTIAANSGYAIQDVLVDGVSQGAAATYTFSNVTAAHTIAASFKTAITSGVLFTENFVYTGIDGDSLTNTTVGGNIWKSHSGGAGAAKAVQFQNSSLSLPGYAGSGLGGSVTFQSGSRSQDVNANIGTNIKAGALYASFLLKIDSSAAKDTSTEYFFHLFDTSGITNGTTFRARLFVSDGSATNKFKFGLSKGTGAKLTTANITAGAKLPAFSTTEYNTGQTYLVVLKYTFNTATKKDDQVDLFVVDAAIPSSEPAAVLSFQDTGISDLKQIQSVVIRQGGSATATRTLGTIDGIKVFTNWSDIVSSTPTTSNIAGSIVFPNNKKVNGATVKLSGDAVNSTLSAVTGAYSFNGLNAGNYSVKPSKNNDVKKNNGVTAIDIILTQRHILNTTKFNSAYKVIAADVNNDKSVSNIDVIFMKRLILGIDTIFTGKRLWAFVDSAYTFSDSAHAFPYKDSISFTNLTSDKYNQTFIGLKLGDVNYDWNPALARSASIANLELLVPNSINQSKIKNDNIEIPIAVKNFKDLVALQYTLNFNNKDFDFVAIRNNKLGIEYNAQQANKTGLVSFLWNDAKAQERTIENGSELFTLVLRAKEFGIKNWDLGLTNDIAEVEAWDNDNQQHNIVLVKANTKEQNPINKDLFTVSPNPTSGDVVIALNAIENKNIVFELSNASGKTIFTQGFEAVKGSNNFHLNLKSKSKVTSGLYFLKANGVTQRIIVNP